MTTQIAGGQILGDRQHQEDRVVAQPLRADGALQLLMVCDGMGGHVEGAVAAETASAHFLRALTQVASRPAAHLRRALENANNAILAAVRDRPELEGMGCTLVAAIVDAGSLTWISVGDSGLFLVRDNKISRLNADHSMRPVLEELVATGRITQAQAESDPQRSALRSALTGEQLELVDSPEAAMPLLPGDRVLAISDGIETLDPETLKNLAAASGGAEEIVKSILQAVARAQRPRQDNASIAIYLHPEALTPVKSPVSAKSASGPTVLIALGAAIVMAAFAAWMVLAPRVQSEPAGTPAQPKKHATAAQQSIEGLLTNAA